MRIFVKIRIGDEHEVITEVTIIVRSARSPARSVAVASGFVAVMSPFANCMMTDFGDAPAGGSLRRWGAYANRVRKDYRRATDIAIAAILRRAPMHSCTTLRGG